MIKIKDKKKFIQAIAIVIGVMLILIFLIIGSIKWLRKKEGKG